jgi:hypothetical protein
MGALTEMSDTRPYGQAIGSIEGETKLFDISYVRTPLGTLTWAAISALPTPVQNDHYELSAPDAGAPLRPDGSPAQAGDGITYHHGAWRNEGPVPVSIGFAPIYHTTYRDTSNVQWSIISDGLRVWAYQMDGTDEELTPAEWAGGRVTFTELNGVLVVNSATDGPYYWPGIGNDLVKLPGPGDGGAAPANGWDWTNNWLCEEMESLGYFLFALGMSEGGTAFPHKFRWSNSAQPGAIPTEWAILATNDAGSDIVGGSSGAIVGGAKTGSALVLVKEDAFSAVSYIAGQFVHRTQRLQGGIGSRNPRGYCEVLGGIAVVAGNDLLFFDGVSPPRSLVADRVREEFKRSISEEYWERSQLHYDISQNRLYLFVSSSAINGRFTRAIVYDLTRNVFYTKKLTFGYGADNAIVTISSGFTWDATPYTWANVPSPWNAGEYTSPIQDVLLYESNDADTAWWVSVQAKSVTNSDGSSKLCRAQRRGLLFAGEGRRTLLKHVYPEVKGELTDANGGQAPIRFRFGFQDDLDGPITWALTKDGASEFLYYLRETPYLDPLLSGRYLVWEVETNDYGTWSLGAMTFEWSDGGVW